MRHFAEFRREREDDQTGDHRGQRHQEEVVGQAVFATEAERDAPIFAGTEPSGEVAGEVTGDRAREEPNAHQHRSVTGRSQARHHRQADRREAKFAPRAEDVAAEEPVSARVAARFDRVERAADHKEERDRQQNETDAEFHRGRRFKAASTQETPKEVEKRRENDDAERVDRLIPSRREGVNRRFLVEFFPNLFEYALGTSRC